MSRTSYRYGEGLAEALREQLPPGFEVLFNNLRVRVQDAVAVIHPNFPGGIVVHTWPADGRYITVEIHDSAGPVPDRVTLRQPAKRLDKREALRLTLRAVNVLGQFVQEPQRELSPNAKLRLKEMLQEI